MESTHDATFRDRCASELLDCLGTGRFGSVLERMLHSIFGPMRFASYRLRDGRPARIAGLLDEGSARRALDDFEAIAHHCREGEQHARVMPDRGCAVVGGRRNKSLIWVVVGWDSTGSMPADAAAVFASRSALLVAAHAKHIELLDARESAVRALASISQIEECLTGSSVLTSREIEVCSRIIYGLSTLGIAVDLSLGEETVRTYRKRAYQRLALGTERQLLTWYLRQWTRWHASAAFT
jgi:DNA-binding CsgD family transcriptional regulator